ncbi:MAG: hypothetical protein K6L73_12135 [Cellvibrionaceae bacterium]
MNSLYTPPLGVQYTHETSFPGEAVLSAQHKDFTYIFIYNTQREEIPAEAYRLCVCKQVMEKYDLPAEKVRLTEIEFSQSGPNYTLYQAAEEWCGTTLTKLTQHSGITVDKLDQLHDEAELELIAA